MAYSPDEYTGNGSTTTYTITFPYLDVEDVKVTLNGAATTAFTIVGGGTQVQFSVAPGAGVAIKIYRETPVNAPEATFYTGASVRAVDLNENFLQNLYYAEETREVANEASTGAIPDGSIGTAKLANDSVTTAKLANDAVTSDKLATDAVDTVAIQASAVTTAKLANSSVTDDKIGNNVLTPFVSSINNGPLAGFRNAVINGNFDVWQRGISFIGIANNAFSADRWAVTYNGGGSRTISQLEFPTGQTDVPFEPTYYLRFNQSVAGSGATTNQIRQRIEDVRTFAGQTVTLSFYAKAGSSITMPSINIVQNFGGGLGSTPVTTNVASSISVGTIWTKYSYTFAVPSISGKTIGTDPKYLSLELNLPLNSTFVFDLAQVQLETSPVATPFERRPYATELQLCHRYFRGPVQSEAMGAGANGTRYTPAAGGNRYVGHITLSPPMRVAPSITLDTSTIVYNNCSGLASGGATANGNLFYVVPLAAGAYAASAWFASFDAEL